MEKLIRGLIDFRKNKLPGLAPLFKELAERGQKPDVLFFACADSRVVPNLMVSTDPGDLFVVRSVGNLVAPANAEGISVGDVSEASAIEFSLAKLKIKHIVVCGHSRCGAIEAILNGREHYSSLPNLKAWLAHGEAAFARLVRSPFIKPELSAVDRLSQANVLQQLEHIASYANVRKLVDEGAITLHGWWFDVGTGDVHVYDKDRGGYILLDEAEAERVLAGQSAFQHS
ncbi:carbonic anhydrase [Polyangium sorediatum]|uniref:carbonic anhydrase n=1 Tax=Polyangium sorediatum TaxID=889274 RepID=A0ABT6NX37_9BACT|nr:carbonic anhydrase [Polyangium sorediatum]MDI1432906.1 carbonic anhydrase [Polyangium sorediatum]